MMLYICYNTHTCMPPKERFFFLPQSMINSESFVVFLVISCYSGIVLGLLKLP